MSKCVFLSTYDEYVECSKDCTLYNWVENDNKCPFTELRSKGSKVKHIYEFDMYNQEKYKEDTYKEEDKYKEDKYIPISLDYKDNYL